MQRHNHPIAWVLIGTAIGALLMFLDPLGLHRGLPESSEAKGGETWTCSMHPQIRMDHPDKCPICGMDLVPVKSVKKTGSADTPSTEHLSLDEHARLMASLETVTLQKRPLFKEIRTVGKIELDETSIASVTARVTGRVDEVFASFPGTIVHRGDHLVSIFSSDLIATQEAFLIDLRRQESLRGQRSDGEEDAVSSSRERLKLWGITDEQIDQLAKTGKTENHLVVYSPIGGTIIEKNIRVGQYVKEGDSLYTVANLQQVWLILDVYESELGWVRFGQEAEVRIESSPGEPLRGTVGFVEPILNESTRTVRVRVVMRNEKGFLKPGMYAQALLRVPLLPDGTPAPTGLEGKHACPMHPYVVSDIHENCRVCGMPLEKIPGVTAEASPPGGEIRVLAVPVDAVLTTGKRQLVYVEDAIGEYRAVSPKLGPRADDFYPVLDGLKEGEKVVVRGNFLLDSQFQVNGMSSLLYPTGIAGGGTGGHSGHGSASSPQGEHEKSTATRENLKKLSAEDQILADRQKLCPITREPLGSMGVPVKYTRGSRSILLCCPGCESKAKKLSDDDLDHVAAGHLQTTSVKSPESSAPLPPEIEEQIAKLSPEDQAFARRQRQCPVTDEPLGSMGVPHKFTLGEESFFLCCEGCKSEVKTLSEEKRQLLKSLHDDAQSGPAREHKHD